MAVGVSVPAVDAISVGVSVPGKPVEVGDGSEVGGILVSEAIEVETGSDVAMSVGVSVPAVDAMSVGVSVPGKPVEVGDGSEVGGILVSV